MVSLASVLLSDRLLQLRCCNMSLTLEVLCNLPVTYLAALLCIDSNLLISSAKYGSQTEQAYSKDGLTAFVVNHTMNVILDYLNTFEVQERSFFVGRNH